MTSVLYIAGAGRSGSTLLELILSGLEGAVGAGELRNIWSAGYRRNQLCACGSEFRACAFWTATTQAAFDVLDERHRAHLELTLREETRLRRLPQLLGAKAAGGAVSDSLRGLYRAISDVGGAGVVVDSSKSPLYALRLAQVDGLEVRMLHVVRDSRAVAHSRRRRRVWRGNPSKPEAMMRTHSPRRTAAAWVLANSLAALASRRVAAYERVRYEDICRDPPAVIGGALARLGLADMATEVCERGVRDVAGSHSVMGNPIRFDRGPLVIKADQEWRTAMSQRDRSMVTLGTWPHLLWYRYPIGEGLRPGPRPRDDEGV